MNDPKNDQTTSAPSEQPQRPKEETNGQRAWRHYKELKAAGKLPKLPPKKPNQ